jgi:hypothetical protein
LKSRFREGVEQRVTRGERYPRRTQYEEEEEEEEEERTRFPESRGG